MQRYGSAVGYICHLSVLSDNFVTASYLLNLVLLATFLIVFIQVGIISDPPHDVSVPLESLFSILMSRLLPAISGHCHVS